MLPARLFLPATVVAVAALAIVSLGVGGYDISLARILAGEPGAVDEWNMFFISRVPRTAALILAAAAMGISGVIMQMITQNTFVEPTTAGTSQWAGLGILVSLLIVPNAPLMLRMLVATAFALVGTLVFLAVLRRLSLRSSLIVPLVGIMLGAVVGSVSTFIALQTDLLQSLAAWRSGGFSSIVRGQYEPLWAVAIVSILAYLLADRFTVAGLGKDIATNVGLHYERVVFLGAAMVAVATGVTSVVVGFLPFIGLIVPNIVRMFVGDDLRRGLPWVVLLGTGLILICDLIGRTIVFPLEIPVSVVLGAIGAALFIALVLRSRRRARA